MEFATISGAPLKVSRVGLGTWAIGGWMWGGTDEEESVKTIRASVTPASSRRLGLRRWLSSQLQSSPQMGTGSV
jgi:hypothetical protein